MKSQFEEKRKQVNEKGASLVITLMVLTLLLGLVALALSRTVNETLVTENDAAESRTLGAAQSGIESITSDFATILENKTAPSESDLNQIKATEIKGFSDNYSFTNQIAKVDSLQTVTLSSGQYQGLMSFREEWQVDVTAKDKTTGTEVQLRRRFFNNMIPIFQFGAFYNDDFEVYQPPLFIFKGRIHTNGNFFVTTHTYGIYLKSKVTIAGELVTDWHKQGITLNSNEKLGNLFIQNADGIDKQIKNNNGSVLCTEGIGNSILIDPTGRNFPYQNCQKNPNWESFSQQFDGNLQTNVNKLILPVEHSGKPLIEMIRRGKNLGDKANIGGSVIDVSNNEVDDAIISKERFANKSGIRISLADSQDRLPQCANIPADSSCGVRLDDVLGESRGYKPIAMTDGYQATALNSNRLYFADRQVWIKVELVRFDTATNLPVTQDITQDFLSLGVTEPAPLGNNLQITGYDSLTDSRSIIKLQRFFMKGGDITEPNSWSYISNATIDSQSYNYVNRYEAPTSLTQDSGKSLALQCSGMSENPGGLSDTLPICTAKDYFASPLYNSRVNQNESEHFRLASINGKKNIIVPFPIQMFDTREGIRSNSALDDKWLFRNGLMSMVDIDIANFRRFLNGEFNGKFPTSTQFALNNGGAGLKNTDVPDSRGWVVYVSDRRGDYNFDGKYNMEDIYPDTNNLLDEDLDNNGIIDTDYNYEAAKPDSVAESGESAVTDHYYYRRGIRLINGEVLPGKYDVNNPSETRGFTIASENGVYVLGNYNVESVNLTGTNEAADSTNYNPQNSENHIPASIIADSVTVLSNNWNDSNSFNSPYNYNGRVATPTQYRFAMIAGDSLTSRNTTDSVAYSGGLINFKRFLESWYNVRLNYSGSLINLFNSFNNNGRYNYGTPYYFPPTRDWTFESTFKDPNRLPPGVPFVNNIAFTGFQRVNE